MGKIRGHAVGKLEAIYPKRDVSKTERLDAIAEILSRGYLRLLLSEDKSWRPNLLKELDNSRIASHELDSKLTARKGRNKL